MSAPLKLSGKQFGRLTVIRRVEKDRWGSYKWACTCDCGKKIIVRGGNLKNKNTQSCGCLQMEIVTKHGHNTRIETSKTYRTWAGIITRCGNPNIKNYHNYGGRGITVCKRWMKFQNFLKDMGESPGVEYSIERINNNKGYFKKNCCWATRKEQARNKRNNRLVKHDNRTQILSEWAKEFDIDQKTLSNRIKRGWSMRKALTILVRKYKSKIQVNKSRVNFSDN